MDKPQAGADIPASASRADITQAPQFPVAVPVQQPQAQYSPDGQWFWNGTEWVPALAQAPTPPNACRICGGTPATQVTLRSVVAFVVMGVTSTQTGVFCRDCGLALFRKRMSQTLLTGWWGFLHFFVNLGVIVGNLSARARIVRLGPATRDPGAQFLRPGRPVFFRAGFAVTAVALIVVGAFLTSEALKPPPAPFPPEDAGFIGQCTLLTTDSWTTVDCKETHDGKIVSLGHVANDCPSQYDLGNLPDGNVVCIDKTQ